LSTTLADALIVYIVPDLEQLAGAATGKERENKGCAQTYSNQLVEHAAGGESCDSMIERFVPFEARRPLVRPNACVNSITLKNVRKKLSSVDV